MTDQLKISGGPTNVATGPWLGPKNTPVDGDGGGPDDPSMEHRLSEVEKAIIRIDGKFDVVTARFEHVDSTLNEIKVGVIGFKWHVFTAALTVIVAVIATGIAIQQMTVTTFQAAAQQPSPPAQQAPVIINVPSAAQPVQPAGPGK